jgi:hypothetical protein
MSRQKLSLNLDTLFPGEVLPIGSSSILIRPLNIKQIAIILKQLNSVIETLSDNGITFDNFNEQGNIIRIAIVLMDEVPDVLSEASDIDLDDLLALPLDVIITILEKVISVNMKSKDDLIKNFLSLTKKLVPETEKTGTTQSQE